jgi:hypothetical protein
MHPERTVSDAVAELIALMRTDEEQRRRWPDHPAMRQWAGDQAEQGLLLVQTGLWFYEVVLDPQGRVLVVVDDGPAGGNKRDANALEAHLVWHRWVPRNYPSLAPWIPAQPPDAVACAVCGGSGTPPFADAHPQVMCACGGAGWIPADAVGLDAFNDWPAAGGDAPAPARSLLERTGRRLRGWFGRHRD